MRIGIIGAGAMGCLFGACLSKKNEVFLIDTNQKVVDTINAEGITVRDKNTETVCHPKAFTSSEALEPMELVIVFVKTLYTLDALKTNLFLINPDTLVLSLQNGAGNDRDLAHFIKEDRILIGTTEHNCLNMGPGRIQHNTNGVTNIGMIKADLDSLNKIKKVFTESYLDTKIYENIQEIIWNKLLINLSINSVTAVLGTKVGYLTKQKDALWLMKALVGEAIDVAIADGIAFDKAAMLANIEKFAEKHMEAITSMSQDVKNHRLTEIDHINGAVVKCAELYGVETPYNTFMVHLLHAMEGIWDIGRDSVLK